MRKNHSADRPAAQNVATRSILIKNMVDDMGEEAFETEEIPIPNVS
jgi:hypothetical protein